MEIQSFNAELALANLMFMRIFSNIRIQKTLANGTEKVVKVNCVLGKRSRILKNWENADKKATYKLPLIAICRTAYARNPERLNNMHNEVKYETTSKYRKYDLLTPVPIDVSYDVTIMSKYPSDIDLIASNFMIFFNSDVYVSCEHPKYEGIQLHNLIIMSDSVTEEHPDELDGSADDIITTTFQFTFKTYLFGGDQQAKKKNKSILSVYEEECEGTYISVFNVDLNKLSTIINERSPTLISVELTGMVSKKVSVELSTDQEIYDGFTPIINQLNIGFYPVPKLCTDYKAYMEEVDTRDPDWPYVDRLYWRVDETSPHEFPDNVVLVNDTYDKK